MNQRTPTAARKPRGRPATTELTRAALAKELGYFPATLDPEDIERHRRLNAALDAAPTREQVARRYRLKLAGENRSALCEDRRRAASMVPFVI